MRSVLTSLVFFVPLLGCRGDLNGSGPQSKQLVIHVKISHDRTLRVCPVVTGISALGLQTATGHDLALEGGSSSPADRYSWSGEGGDFATPDATTTMFQCTEPGVQTLTFSAAKYGCPDANASLEVECAEP